MEISERRAGRDRRSAKGSKRAVPFLTQDGLVFADRRRGDRDRRLVDLCALLAIGDVEEIELEPVRFG